MFTKFTATGSTDICESAKVQVLSAHSKLVPTFISNRGQIDDQVRYYMHRSNYSWYFTPEAAVLAFVDLPPRKKRQFKRKRPEQPKELFPELQEPVQGLALAMKFFGACPDVRIEGCGKESGTVNFFIGSDPAKWCTELSSYSEITYRGLWPGVDLTFRKNENGLKYEFILQPGVDPSIIRLTYEGADSLTLEKSGNLLVHTPIGVLTDERPLSYQEITDCRVSVPSQYVLEEGSDAWGFAVAGDYDPRYPLVIDPGLSYSTYLGGSFSDQGNGIAVDASGNTYVTGLYPIDQLSRQLPGPFRRRSQVAKTPLSPN